MFHNSTTLHHRHRQAISPFKPQRLAHLNTKPDVGLLRKMWYYTGKAARGVIKVARWPYYLMGGGVINATARGVYKTGEAAVDGVKWTSGKINDTGRLGWEWTWAAGIGAAMAGIVAPTRFAIGGPVIAAKRAVWDVPRESFKAQLQVVKSPFQLALGVRDATWGVLNNVGKAGWRTVTGDFSGALSEAKMVLPNLAAPITRPVLPVVKGVRDTVAEALWGYGQFAFDRPSKNQRSSAHATYDLFMNGVDRIRNADEVAKERLQIVRAEQEAEREAKEAEIAGEKAKYEGSDEAPAPRLKKAA